MLNAPRHVNLPEDEGGAMIAGEKLRLLLFQSCPLTRAGLSHVLASTDDIELVSVAACLPEAMARATQTAHDLILMDLDLSCEDSCDPVRRLHHASRGAKILIFSARAGDGEVLRALDAGAAGYILKSAGRDEILSAVQHVVARERYLAPVIAQHLAEYIGKERLTQRELEVLAFVREGFRNRQIAHQLRVAETTVNFHIKNTLRNFTRTIVLMRSPSPSSGDCSLRSADRLLPDQDTPMMNSLRSIGPNPLGSSQGHR